MLAVRSGRNKCFAALDYAIALVIVAIWPKVMEAVVSCGSKFKTVTDYKTKRRKKTASQLVTDLPFSSMEAGQDSDLRPSGKAVLLFKSRPGRKVTSQSCYSLIIPKAFLSRYGGYKVSIFLWP